MKKHWLATMVLMTVMMIGLTLPSVVSAAEISVAEGAAEPAAQSNLVEGNWKYRDNGNGTVTLTGYVQSSGQKSLVIPSVLGGKRVTAIGQAALLGYNARSIIIPEGIVSIGDDAFMNCSVLKTLVIPDSVISIGDDAFRNCFSTWMGGIKKIIFTGKASGYNVWKEKKLFEELDAYMLYPSGYSSWSNSMQQSLAPKGTWIPYSKADVNGLTWLYKSVGNNAAEILCYLEMGDVVTLNVPAKINGKKVTSIADYAFYQNYSVENVVIPEGVTTIGTYVFDSSYNLESVQLPNSITNIGGYTFRNTKIKNIVLSNGLTRISEHLFEYCTYLENITIPQSVTVIEKEAFWGCHRLKSMTLPQGLITIGEGAFRECQKLPNIVIPSKVTSIGDSAFMHCHEVETLIIPSNVKIIPNNAFAYCQNLKTVILPEGVESIGNCAFETCSDLTSIEIPDTVKLIGGLVFTDCENFEKIKFGNSVPAIASNAFAGMTIDAYYPAGSTVWTVDKMQNYGGKVIWRAYKECKDAVGNTLLYAENGDGTLSIIDCISVVNGSILIPNRINGLQVTNIADGAFGANQKITSVVIPDGVTSIGEAAFLGCSNMSSITIPNTVTEIKSYAFAHCSNLRTVALPDGITEIANGTFANCCRLTSVVVPEGVTIIGEYAFDRCEMMYSISLPEGLTTIDQIAFYGCTNLKNLEFPETLIIIGRSSFRRCDSLASIVIPKSVAYIGGDAFDACESLKHIIFEGSAFDNPDSNGNVYHIWDTEAKNVYYPADDTTWSSVYRDKISHTKTTWISYDSEIPFVDIKESDFYFEPVLWALEKNITAGVSEYLFMPTQACTRGQVVTFLWRAMGEEEPTVTSHAFVDVSDSAYYSKAVLWAVENGITYGVDSTHFKPEATVTRGEFVTFLYRVFDKPGHAGHNPFSDIKQEAYYYDAVLWAYENKIAYGYFADLFAPWAQCTRGEVVTFLYRGLYEKPLPVEPIMMSIDTAEACGAYAGDQDEFPVFTDGNKEKWYDRLTWPWYGKTFYDTLCEGTDNDGIKDCFIDWKSSGVAGQIRVSEMKENGEIVESVVPVIKLHGEIFGSGTGEEVILDDFFVDFESKANILAEAFQAFRFDHPEVFWFNDTLNFVVSDLKWEYYSEDQPGILRGSLYLILEMESELTSSHMRYEKYQDVTALKQAIAARDTQIDKIVNAAASLDKLSQLEYFHDWLIMNNEINTNVHSDEDASAMVQSYPEAFECLAALYGNTGAKGPTRPSYAYAYKVLCDKVGIPCVITIGNKAENSDEDFHFWNYVKLERAWYAVDAACDDPSGGVSGAASGLEKDEFFMIGKNTEVATANGTMTFSQSHEVTNILTENDIRYMNGPILSDEKYSCAIESIVLTVSKDTFYADFEELPIVTADVVTAEGVTDEPEFTWYVRTSDGMLKEIEGENSYIVNLPEDEYSGTFVVVVEVTVGNVSRSAQIHINAIKFIDIMESYYYYDAVLWALEHKITSGYTYELFEPNMACTRGQMVTFMWRAAGYPEAENREISFKDVDANAYYYEAVLWAVENNITAGFTKEQFAPESPITRGQLVTFLWRANPDEKVEDEEDGSDGVEHTNPKEDVKSLFEDVEDSAYYYDAVYWAVENDITSGYNPAIFAPEDVATRAQIVTFLWRADKNLTSKQNVI